MKCTLSISHPGISGFYRGGMMGKKPQQTENESLHQTSSVTNVADAGGRQSRTGGGTTPARNAAIIQ